MAGLLKKSIVTMHKDIRRDIEEVLEELKEELELNDLVYTDEAKISRLNPPMIWWFREPYSPSPDGVQAHIHDVPYVFVCMVKDSDPRAGKHRAEELMGEVFDKFMQNRNNYGTWHDVMPGQQNPAHPGYESKKIYWSACRLEFRAKRLIGGKR